MRTLADHIDDARRWVDPPLSDPMQLYGWRPTIAVMMSRLDELEAMVAWRPIATAPKDGAEIMVCGDGCVSMVRWLDGLGWRLAEPGSYAEDSGLCFEPTHWMPVPDPQ
ncbi:MAG: hypothetical protein ABFD89_10045 [Bryobacteraceae bacterium]